MARVLLSGVMLVTAFAASSDAGRICIATDEMDMNHPQQGAPVDYGYGPGRGRLWTQPPLYSIFAARGVRPYKAGAVPNGLVDSQTAGFFAAPVSWPINGLHQILLPDGRVMNYGTDQRGIQGGQMVYDVWDPSRGTGPDSHVVLTNTTQTDIFCSAQTVMWNATEVLITGGDLTIGGKRNFSNNKTTLFSPANNSVRVGAPMAYPRWYPTIVDMPNGEYAVFGGRTGKTTGTATTPEIYNPATGWRTLPGARTLALKGLYPRTFLATDGRVFLVNYNGEMGYFDLTGQGTFTLLPGTIEPSTFELPTLMYAPGKLLSLRFEEAGGVRTPVADTIDITGAVPKVTRLPPVDQMRYWANATIMADGRVFVSGGSNLVNKLPGIYDSLIWHPQTGKWIHAASAATPRLYHSIALLLPDATVLTAAGGSPGPIVNLNAEIYYPPYLYRDATGNPAPRPTLVTAPRRATLGQQVVATVGTQDTIGRVTFVRLGSVTHAINVDQRFIDAKFKQTGQTITATLPAGPAVMLPGYYMMFVFQNGTPSVSKIVLVTP